MCPHPHTDPGTPHHSQDIPLSGHSQDHELHVPNWTSSQESPHITKTAWTGNEPSTRELIDSEDSGFNTQPRSQASFGPDSQETFTTDLSESLTNTPSHTESNTRLNSTRVNITSTSCLKAGDQVKGRQTSKEDIKNSPPGSKSSLFKSNKGR